MKNKKGKIKNNKRGMVMVIAVVILLILVIIGVGLLQLGSNARLQGVKDILQTSARSAADASIEHAVRHMIDSWNTSTNKAAWVAGWEDATVWTNPAVPATPVNYSSPSPVTFSDTFGGATSTYSIYKGTIKTGYQVISTGTAARVTRKVHAAVILKSLYDSNNFSAIAAKKGITVYPNTDLGTIPADGNFTIQSNSTEENAITLKPGITVPGDVVVGPGGDPDVSIDLAKTSFIEGEDIAADEYMSFPPVPVPSYLSGLSFSLPTIDANDPTVAYINGNIKLDEFKVGTAPLATVLTIYVTGDVEIYVDGYTYLPPGVRLIVNDGSTLTLYLGGNMNVKSGSYITYGSTPPVTDEEIIEAVSSISIKGTVAADWTPLCTDIQFFPNGNFYGTIYAPDADPLYIAPNGDFYGGVVGDSVTLKPGGSFFSTVPSSTVAEQYENLYMGIKMGSWWEE